MVSQMMFGLKKRKVPVTRGLTQPGLKQNQQALTLDPFTLLFHLLHAYFLGHNCANVQSICVHTKSNNNLLLWTNADGHLGATKGSWEVVPGFFPLSTQAGVSKNDPEGPVPAKPAGNQQDFSPR